MAFVEELWKSIEPLYEGIRSMDYLSELKAGTLPRNKFSFYIYQDALYLADFGRSLALLAGKATDPKEMMALAQFAKGTMEVEQALHQQFFEQFSIPDYGGKSKTCLAYTQYLLATTALEDYAVGCAAVLPCFWIYERVGKSIYEGAAQPNAYQAWIDTYAGEEFAQLVEQMKGITEKAAARSAPDQRQKMLEAFYQASQLEYAFWDSAYRLEAWPNRQA